MSALDYFAHTDTVHIATERQDGREVVTPIWSVVVDGVPYIRNGYGAGSKWAGRIHRSGHAAFIDGVNRYEVSVDDAGGEELNAKVDAAYRAKYAGQGRALEQMVSPEIRESTIRLTVES
jgi:hypothetical protein